MKAIDNYITERLNPRHLGEAREFPIKGSLDDIAGFLRKNGFKEVHEDHERKLYNYGPGSGKVFLIDRDWDKKYHTKRYGAIYFADFSEGGIGRGNPLYCVFCEDLNERFCEFDYHHYCDTPTIPEFLEAINKRFGWK